MFKAFNHLISKVEITFTDGTVYTIEGNEIPAATSVKIDIPYTARVPSMTLDGVWSHFGLVMSKLQLIYNHLDERGDSVYLMYIDETIDAVNDVINTIIKTSKDAFTPYNDNMHLFAVIADHKLRELKDMREEDRAKSDIPSRLFELRRELNGDAGVTMEAYVAVVDRLVGPCVSVTAYSSINREILTRPYMQGRALCCTYFSGLLED